MFGSLLGCSRGVTGETLEEAQVWPLLCGLNTHVTRKRLQLRARNRKEGLLLAEEEKHISQKCGQACPT